MIPAIVLAAGNSSRMGCPKPLLPVGSTGELMVERMIRILLEGGAEEVVVVLGRDAAAIRAAIQVRERPVRLVENPRHEEGQLSSVLVGLSAIDRPDVRGALVTPVDLPMLQAETVRAIVGAYDQAGGGAIVRPMKDGRHGHPVLFDRAWFQELRCADPASGARSVIHAHLAGVINVDVADEGAFVDVDTPAEYERYVSRA